MCPKELVKQWVEAFNSADADAITALYADNAVNHQVANQPVEGKAAIKAMFVSEFAAAEMVCIPENLLRMASGPFWNGATLLDYAAVASSMWWMIGLYFSVGIGTSCRFCGSMACP